MRLLETLTLAALTTLGIPTAHAQSTVDEMAAELSRLRGEVESKTSEIEEKKEAGKSQMRSLVAQKAGVEAEIQREQLRLQQLEQDLGRIRGRIAEAGQEQDKLAPAIGIAVQTLERTVRSGIPFRTEDRLEELHKIAREVEDHTILPSVALNRLWTWVEDEVRLTRENGLYQQTIEVDGEQMLASVARLGMVALYFKTPDGKYGAAVRQPDGTFGYRPFQDRADLERTAALFEALEKRVRVGFYELPYAISEVR